MKRNFILGLLVVAGFPFIISCDDEPPPPSLLNFLIAEEEVTESNGTLESFHPALVEDATGRTIEVKISLDRPARETSVISFSVTGTADRNAPSTPVGDFNVDGNTITIEKGATEAVISLQLFEDGQVEFDTDAFTEDNIPYEDVIITLESVVSGPAKIGDQNTYKLKILEDDAIIFLVWDPVDDPGDGTGDVDMDIFLWLDDELWDYAINKDTDIEYVIILGGYPEGDYSMSYVYYEGSSDDLDFQVQMYGSLDGDEYPYHDDTDPLLFDGHYTQLNVNTYPLNDEIPEVQVVQSMVKSGTSFNGITTITPLSSGSRTRNLEVKKIDPAKLKNLQERARTAPGLLKKKSPM